MASQDGSVLEKQRHCYNLGRTLAEPSAPEGQKTPQNLPKLGASLLAEPWWNLPRNFVAAQDTSAPENHKESERNSAPTPLLWPKTPKPLPLGRKVGDIYQEILVWTIGGRYLEQDYWGIVSEDMFGTFLGTNQLTNQPKRFLRKISGRYVPRVFLLFLQNILQKVREIVLDRKILSDLLRDMLERMFWVILVSCQICVWHNFGGLVSKDVFTNSSRRYISQVARTIPEA